MFGHRTGGVGYVPTPEQMRDWMNEESPVPAEHHPAIRQTLGQLSGLEMVAFVANCGSSVRGMVHLVHECKAYNDRLSHFLDQHSDIGDPRPRWDKGYGNIDYTRI